MESGVVSEATLNKCCQDSYVKNYTLHTTPSKLKCAFTLAEVLITLGVIGVVAALTMPTLITKYQKQVTVTQLKKAYSEFAQAIQKSEAEYGLMETWDFKDFNTGLERNEYFGENYLFPNIKTIEKCYPTSNKCWADGVVSLSNVEVTDFFHNGNGRHASFMTSSGYSVYYWLNGSGDGMWYVVDINGLKKPNKIGKDIFAFVVNWGAKQNGRRTGYHPAGLNIEPVPTKSDLMTVGTLEYYAGGGDAYYCNPELDAPEAGIFCSGVIALDNWTIKDDYPW